MHFHQRVELEYRRQFAKAPQLRGIENRGDQQNRIGPARRRFDDVVIVDREILA